MRLNGLCSALMGSLLVLLLLLDSSYAQATKKPVHKKQKITDPHYRYQKQYGSYYGSDSDDYKPYKDYKPYGDSYESYKDYEQYDEYDGYGSYSSYGYGDRKKKKTTKPPQLSAELTFPVKQCTVRLLGPNTDKSAVAGWLKIGCNANTALRNTHDYGDYGYYEAGTRVTQAAAAAAGPAATVQGNTAKAKVAGYDYADSNRVQVEDVDDAGKCWWWGNLEKNVQYTQTTNGGPYNALVSLLCELNDQAQKCDPKLASIGTSKVRFTGQGRIKLTYTGGTTGIFAVDLVNPPELVINGVYTGQAGTPTAVTNSDLPLTRFNVGIVQTWKMTNCENLSSDQKDIDSTTWVEPDTSKFVAKLTI